MNILQKILGHKESTKDNPSNLPVVKHSFKKMKKEDLKDENHPFMNYNPTPIPQSTPPPVPSPSGTNSKVGKVGQPGKLGQTGQYGVLNPNTPEEKKLFQDLKNLKCSGRTVEMMTSPKVPIHT